MYHCEEGKCCYCHKFKLQAKVFLPSDSSCVVIDTGAKVQNGNIETVSFMKGFIILIKMQ